MSLDWAAMSYSLGHWTSIAAHTAVAVCQPHQVNVGLVMGTERAALIDTGSSPQQGRDLLAAAEDFAQVPVTHAIITHPHHDHWFGAAGMPGVRVMAHENLGIDVEEEVLEAASSIGLTQLPVADRTFAMVAALDLGGVRLEALHFGAAHTNADLFVVVPEDQVIFMGDLIESAGDPHIGPSSELSSWSKVLDAAIGASLAQTTFIPGHGEPVDREFCFKQRYEIAMVYGKAQQLRASGVPLEQALDMADWPFSEETMRAALPLIYATLSDVKRQLPLV